MNRRSFIALASGLLLPYEPKTVYSFPSPNIDIETRPLIRWGAGTIRWWIGDKYGEYTIDSPDVEIFVESEGYMYVKADINNEETLLSGRYR